MYIVHIKHINKRPDLDPRDHLTLIQQCKIKDAKELRKLKRVEEWLVLLDKTRRVIKDENK